MLDKPRGMCEKEEEKQQERLWRRSDGPSVPYRGLRSLAVSKHIVLILIFCWPCISV